MTMFGNKQLFKYNREYSSEPLMIFIVELEKNCLLKLQILNSSVKAMDCLNRLLKKFLETLWNI